MESTLKFVWGLRGVFWDFTVAFHPRSRLECANYDDAKIKRWPELTLSQLCSLSAFRRTKNENHITKVTKVNVMHVYDLYSLKCVCHSPGQPLKY